MCALFTKVFRAWVRGSRCLINVCGAISKILQARTNVLVIAAIQFILISSFYSHRNKSRNRGAKSMDILAETSGWATLHNLV